MYEILKQYEHAGAREISIKDLREFLGLEPDEYPRWERFKTRILEASKTALANFTDIKFTWEISGKRGRGGKIKKVKFNIEKNNDYVRRITLNEYIIEQEDTIIEEEPEEFVRSNEIDVTFDEEEADDYEEEGDYEEYDFFKLEIYPFLTDACHGEFDMDEMQILFNLVLQVIPFKAGEGRKRYQTRAYDYLKRKYDELKRRIKRKDLPEIKSGFGYFKKIIEADLAALSDDE
jgi:hypothetical protein